MKPLQHTTAKASYYNTRAETYDDFNEIASEKINARLEKILKEHGARTVLDLTCGTGSQLFWLHNAGFTVAGSDISPSMLKIAKQKAKALQVKIPLLRGDCRNIQVGQFDAVITIFNAIGHLTREDFKIAIQNIHHNLKPGGLYIFDIFNLDYLKHENNISKLTIDWITVSKGKKVREIQFSTITDDGTLASYSTYIHQDQYSQPTKISKGYGNTRQVYTADEIEELLEQHGFIVVSQTGIDGEKFAKENTEKILTVAKKI